MNQFEIKNFTIEFQDQRYQMPAVNNVNITLTKGEIFGVVGESGSGKSLTMLAALGLLNRQDCHISGSVCFEKQDITPQYGLKQKQYEAHMRNIWGNYIAVVFQNASSFLNPLVRVDKQMLETLYAHQTISKAAALEKVIHICKRVGIEEPLQYMKRYPYELSGGMKQRVMLAIALICEPDILIADEPTASLDATLQRQVIDILKEENKKGMSIIFITHDLGIVSTLCDRVCIFYGGCILEKGTINNIFFHPKHPYTKKLLMYAKYMEDASETLPSTQIIENENKFSQQGCVFLHECNDAMHICTTRQPLEFQVSETHQCACWLYHSRRLVNGFKL